MNSKSNIPFVATSIRQRVNSVDQLLKNAFEVVSGKPQLISEVQILAEMGAKVAGLSNCDDEQLEMIEDEVTLVLQSIETYCEFILSVATNGNSGV